jgi:hypothetical protein
MHVKILKFLPKLRLEKQKIENNELIFSKYKKISAYTHPETTAF